MSKTAAATASGVDYERTFEAAAMERTQSPLRFLFTLYQGNRMNLAISLVFFMIKHSPIFILPIVTANMINIATNPAAHSTRELWINFIVLGVSIIQNIPTQHFHVSFMSRAVRHVEAGLRSALVRKLQQLSINYHRELQAGMLQSKVLRDAESIEGLSKQLMMSFLPSIINIIIACILTARNSWTVSMFFLMTIPASVLVIHLFRRNIRRTNKEFRKEIEQMSSRVSEMVEMIPVTRAHGLEKVEIAKMDNTLRSLQGKGYRLDITEAFFGSSNWVLFQLFQVCCLLFTIYLAYHGKIPVGDVVMYQGFFGMILGSITSLLNVYPNIAKGFESIHSIREVLRSQEIEDNTGKLKLTNVSGEFSFRDVKLVYPGNEHHVLDGVTLDVRAGECIAFVGESGAGKSTVLNLVTGFLMPTAGQVLVDGIDLAAVDLSRYRKRLSVVPQTTILFSGSIRDNITYGLKNIAEEQIQQVVEMANLREMIERLPQGLDTMVGEHGGKLSGGQRQRIAIARALIRDPRVIILDEATSALDNQSEHHVQKAMQQLIKGRTTFIVAHRLSTIRDADRIAVMKQGRIVEVGTFDELMANKGEFYNLKQLQL
ncbi:ABC transporter ATP-binding protein [Paenibacillus sp. MMS18-CY102]|uniref:ABC transporter ATP-binding protein n=1 Tax=Paenibacillus sp. MMS18-CY102 TaxID=2682849 RepID=UPI001365367D|nr:ABC transporter ATP-binding protein [Paenibacillus sp. MMS18-CY102]MWC30286.1 ATP-binding cassette domain-containing protein [Paenibacillus sp. MMS18-CY102]